MVKNWVLILLGIITFIGILSFFIKVPIEFTNEWLNDFVFYFFSASPIVFFIFIIIKYKLNKYIVIASGLALLIVILNLTIKIIYNGNCFYKDEAISFRNFNEKKHKILIQKCVKGINMGSNRTVETYEILPFARYSKEIDNISLKGSFIRFSEENEIIDTVNLSNF